MNFAAVKDFFVQVRESVRANPRAWIRAAVMLAPLTVLYFDTFLKIAGDWWNDPNNNHGLLIPPLALYFAWRKRHKFDAERENPSLIAGMIIVLGSLAVYFVGRLGAEYFLTRTSAIGMVAGMLLYFYGWKHLRIMAFPLFFLILAIPIPALIFDTVSIPLQGLASEASSEFLTFCDVPVLREGNVLQLTNTALGVAEACSGLRSLVSLIALSVILGYMRWRGLAQRFVLIALSIPVALLLNIVRITITGIIAENWSVKYAMGFFHEFSGWVVFVAAFFILYLISSLMQRFWPSPPPEDDDPLPPLPQEVTA
jgi:exosortase